MSLQHHAVKEHTCERSQAGPACQSAAVVTEHWAAEGGCSSGAPGAAASTSTPALIAKRPAQHGTAQTSAHTAHSNISTTNWIYQQYWDRSLCKVGTAVVQDGCVCSPETIPYLCRTVVSAVLKPFPTCSGRLCLHSKWICPYLCKVRTAVVQDGWQAWL